MLSHSCLCFYTEHALCYVFAKQFPHVLSKYWFLVPVFPRGYHLIVIPEAIFTIMFVFFSVIQDPFQWFTSLFHCHVSFSNGQTKKKPKWLFRGPFVFLTVTTGGKGCRVCPAGCSPQKSHQMATFLHTGAVKGKKVTNVVFFWLQCYVFGGGQNTNTHNGWMDTQIWFLTEFLRRLFCFGGMWSMLSWFQLWADWSSLLCHKMCQINVSMLLLCYC